MEGDGRRAGNGHPEVAAATEGGCRVAEVGAGRAEGAGQIAGTEVKPHGAEGAYLLRKQ